MLDKAIHYQDKDQNYVGWVCAPSDTQKHPAVLIAHDWSGCNDFAKDKARKLAEQGFVGFALDMYGHGTLGSTNEEKMALIQPLVANRAELQARMQCALAACQALPYVDEQRIVVIGYCFGGMCALDLARLNAPIQGAVSFHGLLAEPDNLEQTPIKPTILALHGHKDPMVTPDAVMNFYIEMEARKADWRFMTYGNAYHAFTNPAANDAELGTIYSPDIAQEAWISLLGFLDLKSSVEID